MADPSRRRAAALAEAVAQYGADTRTDAELWKVIGVDPKADTVRATAVHTLAARLVGSRPQRGRRLAAATEVWAYFRARLGLSPVEEFWAIALDVRHRIISEKMLGRGSATGVDANPRDIFRTLISEGAIAVLFCHNHPSGDPTPSRHDIEITRRLQEVGELCGIEVLDHVVVAADGYVSIRALLAKGQP